MKCRVHVVNMPIDTGAHCGSVASHFHGRLFLLALQISLPDLVECLSCNTVRNEMQTSSEEREAETETKNTTTTKNTVINNIIITPSDNYVQYTRSSRSAADLLHVPA